MKKLLLILATIFIFTSCTKDETCNQCEWEKCWEERFELEMSVDTTMSEDDISLMKHRIQRECGQKWQCMQYVDTLDSHRYIEY